jgi:hypothetical protein
MVSIMMDVPRPVASAYILAGPGGPCTDRQFSKKKGGHLPHANYFCRKIVAFGP